MPAPMPRPLSLGLHASLLVSLCAGLVFGVLPAGQASPLVGSGAAATETRSPGEFDAIAVTGPIDLHVRQAASAGLTLTADDNLLAQIETVVEDGRTLKIRFKRGPALRPRTPVQLRVDAVRLGAVSLFGAGDLRLERLDTPRLELALRGSGDAVLSGLRSEALSISLAGSGDVRADGATGQLQLSIAGSGDADLSGLSADDVAVRIAGSGDARVVAHRALDVQIAGSGDVVYSGRATQVTRSIAGSGSVQKR